MELLRNSESFASVMEAIERVLYRIIETRPDLSDTYKQTSSTKKKFETRLERIDKAIDDADLLKEKILNETDEIRIRVEKVRVGLLKLLGEQ